MKLSEQLAAIDGKVAAGELVESAKTFFDKSVTAVVQDLVTLKGKAVTHNLERLEGLLGDDGKVEVLGQRAIEEENATVSLVSFDARGGGDDGGEASGGTDGRSFRLLTLVARKWNDAGKVIAEEYLPVRSAADAQTYFPEERLGSKQVQPRLSFVRPTRKRRGRSGGRPARPIKDTDLQRLPSIGKSVLDAMREAGISTFAHLSDATDEVLAAVREASGRRFANFDPAYWREAAGYALRGEFDKIPAPPKAKKAGGKRGQRVDATTLGDRDLGRLEKVGPNLLRAFHEEGIETFADLAAATDEQLERLRVAGGRPFVNFDMTYFRLAAQRKLDGAKTLPPAPSPQPRRSAGISGRRGREVNPNDLHILPGVGRQLVEALHQRGINTFDDLAGADRDTLAEARATTRGKYKNIDLAYLQRQARHAAAGKYDRIDAQVKIEKTARQSAASARERQAARLRSAGETDLGALPGVGASVLAAMNAAGVETFADLAGASDTTLATIAANSGRRFANFDAAFWREMAGHALAGDFDKIPAKPPKVAKPATARGASGGPRQARPPRTPKDNKDLGALPSVGAKILSALHANGITTFGQLAKASTGKLEKVREEAGPRFATFPVEYWRQAAAVAKEGRLDYPPVPRKEKPAKTGRRGREAKPLEPTKLRALANVGASMAAALRDNGIRTWQDIVDAPAWQISKAASEAGRRFKNLDPEELKRAAKDALNGKFPEPSKRRASNLPEGAEKLTKLSGIGKSVQSKLFERGVLTYRDLADANVGLLEAVRDEVGKRVARADVRAWKEQARLAAAGQWSKIDPSAYEADDDAPTPRSGRPKPPKDGDDLTKLKGIGPQAQQMFRSRGIKTYADVAAMEPDAIMALIDDSGARIDPEDYEKVQAKARKLAKKK